MRWLAIALVLASSFAFTYDWDYWEDRCIDFSGEEGSDFIIYWRNSSYRTSSGMLVIEVEPLVDVVEYVPNYSYSTFADFERPVIPSGFEYPSTIPIRVSNNYSFFVPFGYSSNSQFFFRLVTNNSEGFPRCSEKEWEINDSYYSLDEVLDLDVDVGFEANSSKFIYYVTNNEEMMVPISFAVMKENELQELVYIQADEGVEEPTRSKKTYESLDVSQGIYKVYAVSADDDSSYLDIFDRFEFYDFNVSLPTIPNFHPGDSYSVYMTIRNTGYNQDCYDFNVTVPEGWDYSIMDPGCLDKAQEIEVKLSYTVPELQVGSGTISVDLISLESDMEKSFDLEVEPEKLTTLEVNIRDISELVSYNENNFTLSVVSAGTVSPKLYYYVYTEPALMLRKGIDSMVAEIGEINKKTVNFEAGGSCAMSDENSLAFNAARKLHMMGKAIYYLTSEISETNIQTVEEMKDIIEAEKLKMTSPDSTKLYSDSDNLINIIDRFIDGWEYSEDDEYYRALREDLYLFLVDLDADIQDVGERMSETCSSVDQVVLHIFVMDLETLQYRDIPRTLEVTGPKVKEFIGPSNLKAVSGSSTYFDYVLKNNAGEGFEVDMIPSSDVVRISPAYTYLPSDSSKDVEVRISTSDYFEADGMKAYIEIKTRTYTINYPITLEVGVFEPELVAEEDYAAVPGVESSFNMTLKTGGLDDTFSISASAPSWVTMPERVATKDGEAVITVETTPSSSVSGEEVIELGIRPESFPEYLISETIYIYVSTEVNDLLDRLRQDEGFLQEKQELLEQKLYVDASRYLDKAETAIRQNDYTSAKLNLNRAENIIFSAKEEEDSNTGIFIAGGVLLVFGFLFWKFLLPKIRGTPTETPSPEEEVI